MRRSLRCASYGVESLTAVDNSAHGATAPWSHERDLSGTASSGSNDHREPSPWQAGQAPCGLVKLKLRGSIAGSPTPQWGQLRSTLGNCSTEPSGAWVNVTTPPPENLSARSRLSARPGRIPSRIEIRSTTASMGTRLTDSGEHQPQVIVNLGDGPQGAPWIPVPAR
jgi:hypothetical protein